MENKNFLTDQICIEKSCKNFKNVFFFFQINAWIIFLNVVYLTLNFFQLILPSLMVKELMCILIFLGYPVFLYSYITLKIMKLTSIFQVYKSIFLMECGLNNIYDLLTLPHKRIWICLVYDLKLLEVHSMLYCESFY